MSCVKCAQPGTRFCPKCKTTCYCSRTCERSDSKPHSKVCGKPSAKPSAASSSSTQLSSSTPPPIPDQSDDPLVPPGWIQYRAEIQDRSLLNGDRTQLDFLDPFTPSMLAGGQMPLITNILSSHGREIMAYKDWKCRCGKRATSMASAPMFWPHKPFILNVASPLCESTGRCYQAVLQEQKEMTADIDWENEKVSSS